MILHRFNRALANACASLCSRWLTSLLAFAVWAACAGGAHAAIVDTWSVSVDSSFEPLSIVDSSGNTPGVVTISNGDKTLRWGSADESGLDVSNSPINTAIATSIMPTLEAPVSNVFLTHTDDSATGEDLDTVTLLNQFTLEALTPVGTPDAPINLQFMIDFQEAQNTLDPCPDGGANGLAVNVDGCGDLFVIGTDALNYAFTYDAGDGEALEYYVSLVETTGELQSLSTDACFAATGSYDPCLGFITPENATTAIEFGTYISTAPLTVQPPPIPTPGALSLVGLGLLTLAGMRRRHRT